MKIEQIFKLGIYSLLLASIFPTIVGGLLYIKYFFPQDPMYHIAYTNLFTTGISTFTLTYWGLKQLKAKWIWVLLFFITNWAATNDLLGILEMNNMGQQLFLFPILPLTLGNIGLACTFPQIFARGIK